MMTDDIRARRYPTLSVALSILGLGALGLPVAAQKTPSTVCLTPGPAAECRSFIVTEVRGQSPFAPADRPSLHQSLGWDLGLEVNVADPWAVGATVGYEFASEATRRRIASLRLRRWLTPTIGLELTPGVFQVMDRGYDPAPDRTGINVSVRALLFDVGLVGLRFDALPATDDAPFEYALSASGGLQAVSAAAGTLVGTLVVLVAIGAAIGASG